MTIDSVQELGKIEIEKKITDKLTVKLRSLTASEYASVMKGASTVSGVADLSALGHLASLQISTLAYATVALNGKSATPAEFRELYENMQYPLVAEIYNVYVEILNKQNEYIEELKKNLMNLQPAEKTT
jgi:hypothetical protein